MSTDARRDGSGGRDAGGRPDDALRVLLIPVYTGNPYGRLLASALRERGLEVTTSGRSGRLPLLRAVHREGRPDVAHLQWQHRFFLEEDEAGPAAALRTLLFFLQWAVLRLWGVRFVWTVHNVLNHERQLTGLELAACRVLARLADGVVVHCEAAAERVSEAYRVPRERLEVVPHGHYVGAYPEPPERGEARRDLGLGEDALVVLHFGHIRPYKGVDRLVRAFRAVDREEMRLLIVGEPRYESLGASLRRSADGDPRIRLELSFASERELVARLSAADVVALPYAHSLTSGSAVLAASCGRPSLAPAVGCLRDFPDDAIVRYPPEEPGALERALRGLGREELDRMGRRARRFVREAPWSRVADETLGVYREAGARAAPGEVRQPAGRTRAGETR